MVLLAKPSDPRAVTQQTFRTREASNQVSGGSSGINFLLGDASCGKALCCILGRSRTFGCVKSKFPEYLAQSIIQNIKMQDMLLVPRFSEMPILKTNIMISIEGKTCVSF
ncbi:hypothetical protein NPIL_543331 [Nephila pilipes]|uniref:Uncharacterized protein n=1 Tax=Nephila pilipes TaxID=299642 RepID=A0A8X6PXP0_NEPPI|nr:hypothetical protein NPIL_543331 [Nephila pilipes]